MSRATQVLRHEIGLDGVVVINVRDGDIRLRGVAGGEVRIDGVESSSPGRMAVETGDRSISIRAGVRADLAIELPAAATVVVDGANTQIDADGLTGDQRYRTATGDVRLQDSSGTLDVDAVSGDVAVSGERSLAVAARTQSGRLRIRSAVLTALRAATTSGELAIAGSFEGGGPFSIETVSGDTTIEPRSTMRVEVRTITGDVRTGAGGRMETDGRSRVVSVGTGGPTISFRSLSGDLRVRDANPNEPADGRGPGLEPSQDDEHFDVLRALERGDIDVAEAERRLAGSDHHEAHEESSHA